MLAVVGSTDADMKYCSEWMTVLAVVGSSDADIKYCSDWMMVTCLFVCPCG